MTRNATDAFEFHSWNFFRSATVEDVRDRLRSGCDPNTRKKGGWTPLHKAVEATRDPEVITAMLEAGGNARSRTDGDVTPLHIAAAQSDEPQVLELLLGAGAEPNARSFNDETPLHRATERNPGNPRVIEVLLRAGAQLLVLSVFRSRFPILIWSGVLGISRTVAEIRVNPDRAVQRVAERRWNHAV